MENLPINVTDIAVAVILILSGLMALARGFVHEVLSIGSWVGAIVAALFGFPYVRPYARDLIGNEFIADIAAGAGTFILALIILTLITKTISDQVQDSALNPLDRTLGFVFGLVRGAVIVCIIYFVILWFIKPEDQPTWLREAKTMPFIEQGTELLQGLIPSEAEEKARETQNQANEALELQKNFEKLLTPDTKSDTTPPTDPQGYDQQERSDMDRLFRNNAQ